MKIQFSFRQKAGILPVAAALLITFFSNTAAGKAQGAYATAGTGQPHDMGGPDVANIVGQLEYNALLALLGAVVLMGIIYICHISKACADLNRPHKNIRNLVMLVAVLGYVGSSCTAEQRAMATEYRAATEAEYRACPMNHHYCDQADPAFNNRYPTNSYSSWYGPSFCKYCGQKVFNNR